MQSNNGVIYAGRVLGREIKNMAGEGLGEIKELAIDNEDGRLMYAIVKIGGGFMKSGKLYAVPWDVLQMSKDAHVLLLDFDRGELENVPTFDEHNWPNMTDRHWGAAVYAFFGGTPYWERNGQTRTEQPVQQREPVATTNDA